MKGLHSLHRTKSLLKWMEIKYWHCTPETTWLYCYRRQLITVFGCFADVKLQKNVFQFLLFFLCRNLMLVKLLAVRRGTQIQAHYASMLKITIKRTDLSRKRSVELVQCCSHFVDPKFTKIYQNKRIMWSSNETRVNASV